MAKKQFFREATKAEIKRKNLVDLEKLSNINLINENEYVIFNEYVPKGFESARKFMKHGPEVKLKRFYTLKQALDYGKTPVQLREESFNEITSVAFCGYTFLPIGKDKRKRKLSLVECLEGARIFAYAHQSTTNIKVKAYEDAKRVRIDGAEVVISLPSRTKGKGKMQFKFISVPITDSPEKYGIALNIGSDHSCPSKRFNIRYRFSDDKEGSGIFNLCAHEYAGYLKLIEQQWNEKKNIIPLQMSQFAIPTQETVDYYLKLENNLLIRDKNLESEDKLRKPNRADKEIALWGLVKKLKHDRTFFSIESRDGLVQNYIWKK